MKDLVMIDYSPNMRRPFIRSHDMELLPMFTYTLRTWGISMVLCTALILL